MAPISKSQIRQTSAKADIIKERRIHLNSLRTQSLNRSNALQKFPA